MPVSTRRDGHVTTRLARPTARYAGWQVERSAAGSKKYAVVQFLDGFKDM